MQPLSAAEIRERYQRFFEARGHTRVPPAPLLAKDDPTLLFVNSGMVPFKRVLTGEEKRGYSRAVSAQPCLRVAGRHNDFEEVGRTPRHQTLFEMLGNWSFGDYFKRDAIHFAWEFLTVELGLPPERIAVTTYRDDDEAHRIWTDEIGVPPERMARWGNIAAGDEQNFWRMGDTGPCGPCSELHYDRGAELSEGPHCIPDHSETCPRWLEIWNLVFMEFDRAADGTLTPLPFKSVDTGMGLERTTSALQGVESNYRTDLFVPIIERLAEVIGHDPETVESERFSYQVVADHSRAMTFLIGEGVTPSNEGAGYVLRRIIRRAVRHGRLLGITRPFLRSTCEVVIDLMGGAYPALAEGRDRILEGVTTEEEKFARTLEAGLNKFEAILPPAPVVVTPDPAVLKLDGSADRTVGCRCVPAARHLRFPDRPHRGDGSRARRRCRPRRLRRGDGRAAPALARRPRRSRSTRRIQDRGAAQRVHRLSERDKGRRPPRARVPSRYRRRADRRRARPHAVLRRGWRADRRSRGADRPEWSAGGGGHPARGGRDRAPRHARGSPGGRRRRARGGGRATPLVRGAQPHRHAPAAPGAARRHRRAGEAGRQLGRARWAALRLPRIVRDAT